MIGMTNPIGQVMGNGSPTLPARSPAQRAASRANGATSRGPVSVAGKAKSAVNALQHGLLARYNAFAKSREAITGPLGTGRLALSTVAADAETALRTLACSLSSVRAVDPAKPSDAALLLGNLRTSDLEMHLCDLISNLLALALVSALDHELVHRDGLAQLSACDDLEEYLQPEGQ